MTLGWALLIIFVLYLIHINKVWKGAAITAGVIILLAGLAAGGFWAYSTHEDAVAAKAQSNWNVVSVAPRQSQFPKCSDLAKKPDHPNGASGGTIPPPPPGFFPICLTDDGTQTDLDSWKSHAKEQPIDQYAGLVPKPVWVYLDVAEEFGGYVTPRPEVPPQIVQMVAKDQACVPGSITWGDGSDGAEWLCVKPQGRPKTLHSGEILEPATR
jgi:hypothetical protein